MKRYTLEITESDEGVVQVLRRNEGFTKKNMIMVLHHALGELLESDLNGNAIEVDLIKREAVVFYDPNTNSLEPISVQKDRKNKESDNTNDSKE